MTSSGDVSDDNRMRMEEENRDIVREQVIEEVVVTRTMLQDSEGTEQAQVDGNAQGSEASDREQNSREKVQQDTVSEGHQTATLENIGRMSEILRQKLYMLNEHLGSSSSTAVTEDVASMVFENESVDSLSSPEASPLSSPPVSVPTSPRQGVLRPFIERRFFAKEDLLKQNETQIHQGEVDRETTTTKKQSYMSIPSTQPSKRRTGKKEREKESSMWRKRSQRRSNPQEEPVLQQAEVLESLGFLQAPNATGTEGVFDVAWGETWAKVEWRLLKEQAKQEVLAVDEMHVMNILRMLPLTKAEMKAAMPTQEVVHQVQAKILIALEEDLLESFNLSSLNSVESVNGAYKHAFIFFEQPSLAEMVVAFTLRWNLALTVQYIACCKMLRDLLLYYAFFFVDLGGFFVNLLFFSALATSMYYGLSMFTYRGSLSPTLFRHVLPVFFGSDPQFVRSWRRRFLTTALLVPWTRDSPWFPEILGVLALYTICSFLDQPQPHQLFNKRTENTSLSSGSKVLDVTCSSCLVLYSLASWSRMCFVAYAVFPELALLSLQLLISILAQAVRNLYQ